MLVTNTDDIPYFLQHFYPSLTGSLSTVSPTMDSDMNIGRYFHLH